MKLYKGDCLIESDNIESGLCDLILCDLPYGTVKDLYKNTSWDIVIDTEKIYRIANRILRKNGKMVLFCQEPFTTELMSKALSNISFNQRLIWEKDSSGNMLFAKKACVNFYEDILVFSKSYDDLGLYPLRQYGGLCQKFINKTRKERLDFLGNRGSDHFLESEKNPLQFSLCTEKTYNKLITVFNLDSMQGFQTYKELLEVDKKYQSTFNLWEGKKYKSNILKYKKDYNGFHPTQKPILLLEDLIKTFSNEGDLVVDLTMGSGSTGVASVNTRRDFTGIEVGDNFFNISVDRIKQAIKETI